MEHSTLLAQLIGPAMVAVGLGILVSGKFYHNTIKQMLKDGGPLSLMGGIISIIAGMAVVLNHNVWEASWMLIITIIGWGALVKGVFLLVLPETMMDIGARWVKNKSMLPVVGVLYLLFGGMLLYYGFFA